MTSGQTQPAVAGQHDPGDEAVLDQGDYRLCHIFRVAVAADQGSPGEDRESFLFSVFGQFIPPSGLDHRFLATRRADLGQILRRAVARGEIGHDNAALALDFIYGSLWYRLIFRTGPLDYRWADQVATAIASL